MGHIGVQSRKRLTSTMVEADIVAPQRFQKIFSNNDCIYHQKHEQYSTYQAGLPW